jgi:hypothetical protein
MCAVAVIVVVAPPRSFAQAPAASDQAAVPAPAPKAHARAKSEPKGEASAAEIEFWSTIENSANPADFEASLETHPNGTDPALARRHTAVVVNVVVTRHDAA